MNLKRVTFNISYVVDGDNQDMVDDAMTAVYDDVHNAVKFDEVASYIEVVDAPGANEEDIPEFLIMDKEDE